jgi:hypothetical protein
LLKRRLAFPAMLGDTPGAPPRGAYHIALNPFQWPGQRPLGAVRLPNVSNGFTMVVVGKD